jgi:hypothetical protein
MMRKRVSAIENAENVQFFHDIGIQYLEVIYEDQVMALIQNHTKYDFEKKYHLFSSFH